MKAKIFGSNPGLTPLVLLLVPGGEGGDMLTQKFGAKAVFGYSLLVTAMCSLLIPQAASIHYRLLIVLRSIQGVASVCL
ncbi:hypothetical protein J6590_062968 [Homalodisca vitripennis]|nr:hypothetical protein J6590_062968 [Homalodisca vitripennis]